MTEGRAALEKINTELGLSFDEFDLEFYTELFVSKFGVCRKGCGGGGWGAG